MAGSLRVTQAFFLGGRFVGSEDGHARAFDLRLKCVAVAFWGCSLHGMFFLRSFSSLLPPGARGNSGAGDRLHEGKQYSSGRPASPQARRDAPGVSGILGLAGAVVDSGSRCLALRQRALPSLWSLIFGVAGGFALCQVYNHAAFVLSARL